MQWLCVLVAAIAISPSTGQHDAFALPQAPRFAPKPTVPPEYSSFFELDGHARELVDSLLGPRPGGLFPEKTYEIGVPSEPVSNNKPVHVPSTLERTLEQFFTAPESTSGQALPPGFGSGFSLLNNNKPLTTFGSNMRRTQEVGIRFIAIIFFFSIIMSKETAVLHTRAKTHLIIVESSAKRNN